MQLNCTDDMQMTYGFVSSLPAGLDRWPSVPGLNKESAEWLETVAVIRLVCVLGSISFHLAIHSTLSPTIQFRDLMEIILYQWVTAIWWNGGGYGWI